ncbi:Protein of unknown function [Agreia bicolorata]|uniref:Heparan-alpha-glucosaminide N-acetyltransferase catalytic domain-containing protein n=1 Tax=Agreia bicolorata TaxID=110935 RepID=A0A1T4WR27_9MICO|nr:heparan-alpha-glucosaminide N-acetyltransferase domain-containing protein [Agreia bicolorata]SKA79822.1 Protein of unknown function [Agreia bicolorata]
MKHTLAGHHAPATTTGESGRIIAVDLARLIAVLGMIAEHLLLGDAPEFVLTPITGFPSTLFAVLGGVSVALSIHRFRDSGQHLRAALTVAVRGVLIAAIGLILSLAPTFVVVILVYYGVTMVLLAVLVNLRSWMLLTLAILLVILGPQLNIAVFKAANPERIGELPLTSPGEFLQSVAFTGMYPAITWLGYMIVGLLVGRWIIAHRSQNRRATGSRLAIIGCALLLVGVSSDLLSRPAVIDTLSDGHPSYKTDLAAWVVHQQFGHPLEGGWIALVNAAPHSGSTADMIRTIGAAVAILGILLWITANNRPMNFPMRALQRAGGAPLTIYVAHILSLAFMGAILSGSGSAGEVPWWALGPGAIALQYLGICVLGAVLAGLNRRGPLETAVSWATRSIVGCITLKTPRGVR